MTWEIVTGKTKKKKIIKKEYFSRRKAIKVINELKKDYEFNMPLFTKRKRKVKK